MIYKNAEELFNKFNIELSKEHYHNLCDYEEMLLEWNETINLTAITEDKEIWLKHFLDSCTINKYIDDNSKIIDVGTGAGFPSIPLRIMNNTLSFTLLDSLNKRIKFLREVTTILELDNIDFIHGRAEDVGNDKLYREKYDIVTARAVANMSTLSELCLPFIKVGGNFICMKAGDCQKEIEEAKHAITILGGKITMIENIEDKELDYSRTIIMIEKVKKTPSTYPRKAGTPAKKPLI